MISRTDDIFNMDQVDTLRAEIAELVDALRDATEFRCVKTDPPREDELLVLTRDQFIIGFGSYDNGRWITESEMEPTHWRHIISAKALNVLKKYAGKENN